MPMGRVPGLATDVLLSSNHLPLAAIALKKQKARKA
jgi:hypothetical protein